MYPNVGKELKSWARFVAVLCIIPAVILGIIVFLLCVEVDKGFLGVVLVLVILGIGYLFARLSGILLYAYGELVDSASEIRDEITKKSV